MKRISKLNRNFNKNFCLPSIRKSQAKIVSDNETLTIPDSIMQKLKLVAENLGIDVESLIRVDGLGHVFNKYWDFRENRPKGES